MLNKLLYKCLSFIILHFYTSSIIDCELVSQNVHKAHLNYVNHDAYYSATPLF